MNKEIIKKYKEAFNYWLDGGKVWLKWSNIHGSKWELENYYDWKEADSCMGGEIVSVIQNDKYAELRKAQVDGKTLQVNVNYNKSYPVWEERDIKIIVNKYTPEIARIKPDEPTFKVGDWVRNKDSNILSKLLKESDYDKGYFKTTNDSTKGYLTQITSNTFELWEPQPGEWCWFWNNLEGHMKDTPQLLQFKQIDGHVRAYRTIPAGRFGHCEPFIGTLPSNLQP